MSYRIIIWEGNELVGKSTLKKEFEIATNFRHLCVDRMFVTSLIYNEFKGRHSDLESQLWTDLENFINEFNPLFVIVKADIEVQKDRFDKRGEWYIKVDELDKLNAMYDKFAIELKRKWPENFIILSNNDREEMKEAISIVINKAEIH